MTDFKINNGNLVYDGNGDLALSTGEEVTDDMIVGLLNIKPNENKQFMLMGANLITELNSNSTLLITKLKQAFRFARLDVLTFNFKDGKLSIRKK